MNANRASEHPNQFQPIPRKNSSRASLAHPIDRSIETDRNRSKPKNRNRNRNRKTEIIDRYSHPIKKKRREIKSLNRRADEGKISISSILSPNLTRLVSLAFVCLFCGLGVVDDPYLY